MAQTYFQWGYTFAEAQLQTIVATVQGFKTAELVNAYFNSDPSLYPGWFCAQQNGFVQFTNTNAQGVRIGAFGEYSAPVSVQFTKQFEGLATTKNQVGQKDVL